MNKEKTEKEEIETEETINFVGLDMAKSKEIKIVPYWKPEMEGDTISGIIIDIEESEEQKKIYLSVFGSDEAVILPSHADLMKKLKFIKKGQKVGIAYIGEEPSSIAGNSPSKKYTVFLEN
jgi:hypothetical protein